MITAFIALTLNGFMLADGHDLPSKVETQVTIGTMTSVVGYRPRPGDLKDSSRPISASRSTAASTGKADGESFNWDAWNRDYVQVNDGGRKIWVDRGEGMIARR